MPFDLAVIDLDNTLYPATNGVFARMDKRMTAFVARELDVDYDTANELRVRYWKGYGTTLRGMMLHHDMKPEPFLHYVHDIDVREILEKDEGLAEALSQLPGRKVIHTNGTSEHAVRVLETLGVRDYFDSIYDIRFNDYIPKPCKKTLQMLLSREQTQADRAIIIDDMEDNLKIARELGAKTAWVSQRKQKSSFNASVAGNLFLPGVHIRL